MLGVILFLLKLLGIILLVIWGIILLVIALVLFAPIKYNGKGSKYGEELRIQALVTYLNPIVRVKVQYPDEYIVQVKICGFTVFSTGQKAENSKERTAVKSVKEERDEEQKEKAESSAQVDSEAECQRQYQGSSERSKEKEEGSSQQSNSSTAGEQSVQSICETKETVAEAKEQGTESTEERSGQTDSQQSAKEKGSRSSKDVSNTGQEQNSSKNNVLDTVGYYVSLFQENKGLILEVIKTVLLALKTILPRKCRIKAVFGTGEADTTGFIYAAYCALEDFLPGEIIFEPVWTEKFTEGEFELKGKIRVIHFVAAVIKIIANKDVRLLIKKIRRV